MRTPTKVYAKKKTGTLKTHEREQNFSVDSIDAHGKVLKIMNKPTHKQINAIPENNLDNIKVKQETEEELDTNAQELSTIFKIEAETDFYLKKDDIQSENECPEPNKLEIELEMQFISNPNYYPESNNDQSQNITVKEEPIDTRDIQTNIECKPELIHNPSSQDNEELRNCYKLQEVQTDDLTSTRDGLNRAEAEPCKLQPASGAGAERECAPARPAEGPRCCNTPPHQYTLSSSVEPERSDCKLTCDTCNKRFTDTTALSNHLRIHNSEKPYSCNVCNKRFRHQHNLTKHLRIHTGEKSYTCDVCNKRFAFKQGLFNHTLIHEYTLEKPYKCDVCNKRFAGKQRWAHHVRVHRGFKNRSAANGWHKKFQ